MVDAGALPLILLTGAQLAEEAVRPVPGHVVLVTGAVGSVGRAALFGARAAGAKVWAGVRKSQRAEAAKLGASGVVVLDDEGDWSHLPMLDAIADTVGGESIKRLYDKLKPGGVMGSVVGEPTGAKERGFTVRAFMAHPSSATLSIYATAVARQELVIPIAKRFPPSRARPRHKRSRRRESRGARSFSWADAQCRLPESAVTIEVAARMRRPGKEVGLQLASGATRALRLHGGIHEGDAAVFA